MRAAIVGMLMPASDDATGHREVFLQTLTMDDDGDGAWARCKPPAQRKLGRAAFDGLAYAERIAHCERPENVAGPDAKAWGEINAHLGTSAANLPELVEQLGQRTFGHRPRCLLSLGRLANFDSRLCRWIVDAARARRAGTDGAVDGIAGSEHGKQWGNDIKTGEQTGEQLSVICTVA